MKNANILYSLVAFMTLIFLISMNTIKLEIHGPFYKNNYTIIDSLRVELNNKITQRDTIYIDSNKEGNYAPFLDTLSF